MTAPRHLRWLVLLLMVQVAVLAAALYRADAPAERRCATAVPTTCGSWSR